MDSSTTSIRFDLEQAIMDCWSVTNDLQTVTQIVEGLNLSPQAQDKLQNVLLGLEVLYQQKFEHCFDLFEKYIKESTKQPLQWPDIPR
jgi:hypothetical protein